MTHPLPLLHRQFCHSAKQISGWLLAGLAWLSILSGCDRDPMVRVYEVELRKPNPASTAGGANASQGLSAAVPKRMLGAVIPAGERSIFLKMTGDPDKLQEWVSDLQPLAQSAKLSNTGDVEIELPDGWTKGPGTSIAAFTLVPPVMDGVDAPMTVTVLPGATELAEWQAYAQQNLDRWRGQLGLPSVPLEEDLKEAVQSTTSPHSNLPVYLVNYVGQSSGKPSMPPFAAGADRNASSATATQATTAVPKTTTPAVPPAAASDDVPKIKFDLPEGWVDQTGQGSPIRLATLRTSSSNDAAEVSVVMAGGEERTIVDLWAQSVLGAEVTDTQFIDSIIAGATTIESASKISGKIYRIKPPKEATATDAQAIIVAVFPVDGTKGQRSLFAKLTGSVAVVDENTSKFEAFVQSLNWQ